MEEKRKPEVHCLKCKVCKCHRLHRGARYRGMTFLQSAEKPGTCAPGTHQFVPVTVRFVS